MREYKYTEDEAREKIIEQVEFADSELLIKFLRVVFPNAYNIDVGSSDFKIVVENPEYGDE